METFCCCAAEAQLYKCVCIYNNIGSLNDVIGNRGLSLEYDTNNYSNYLINSSDLIFKLMDNETKKKDFIERGHEYAKTLASCKVKDKWLDLFNL